MNVHFLIPYLLQEYTKLPNNFTPPYFVSQLSKLLFFSKIYFPQEVHEHLLLKFMKHEINYERRIQVWKDSEFHIFSSYVINKIIHFIGKNKVANNIFLIYPWNDHVLSTQQYITLISVFEGLQCYVHFLSLSIFCSLLQI